MTSDALVVGGGPAGSATALRLARAGHRVTLLDRARFPRDKACAEYASPGTLRELDLLGVLPALDRPDRTPLAGSRVVAPRGAALVGRFAAIAPARGRSTGLALPRRELDAVLLAAAREAGVAVLEGHRVLDLAPGPGVVLEDAEGRRRTLAARVVVGADGLRSVVARRAGLRRQGPLRRTAFVAHCTGVTGVGDTAELHVGLTGYVGLNPLGGGVTNVALVVPAAHARGATGDPDRFFRDGLAAFGALASRLATARTIREVMVTGPFDAGVRRSVADGVLLVGDAADFFDPFTGEGICAALTGAALAAATLDEALRRPGPLTAARLAGYRRARRHRFLGKWLVERMIGYALETPRLFERAVDRLDRRGLADTLIGVTGDMVSPWRVMNPWFLARMLV